MVGTQYRLRREASWKRWEGVVVRDGGRSLSHCREGNVYTHGRRPIREHSRPMALDQIQEHGGRCLRLHTLERPVACDLGTFTGVKVTRRPWNYCDGNNNGVADIAVGDGVLDRGDRHLRRGPVTPAA